jgi:hypothetical protein
VWIETWTLDTDNESRDKDMRETLEVKKYPQIVFTLESVEGKLKDLRGEFKARGRFFIRGREKESVVAFRTEPVEGGGMRVLGEAKLKLSDYGVKPPSVVFVTVDDNVRVWFDLRLARAPEKSVPAKVIDVVVHEPDETDVVGRLWIAPSGALWEQPKALAAPWIVARGEVTEAFLPESATSREALPSKETTAPVEKKETGPGNVVLSAGGVERVTFEGLTGDAPFARMLAFVEPLTPDMQTALASVRGVPKRVKIMTPAGGLELDVVLGAEKDAQFPDWALDPGSWSRAPKPPGAAPKEASGKPAKSGG